MKKIVILLVMTLASFNIQSSELINGAFGLELGNVFETNDAIGRGELTDGTPMYKFLPSKSFRSFSRYFVLITPKTRKIYSIWGIGNTENDASCKKEQALVMSILQSKYGDLDKADFTDSLYDIKKINQGNRSILTKCNGFSEATLDIRYKDDELAKIAENERIIIESEKVDSSGL